MVLLWTADSSHGAKQMGEPSAPLKSKQGHKRRHYSLVVGRKEERKNGRERVRPS